VALCALLLTACASIPTTGPDGPKGIVFAPRQGDGPPVLVISGRAGPEGLGGAYRAYAQRFADAGFRAVLIDGNAVASVFREAEAARENLRKALGTPGGGRKLPSSASRWAARRH
jgi:dienelactone hydrolase